jgi:phosphoglycerate dehydrogenase-like enzyme
LETGSVKARVGIDVSVDESLLRGFNREVEIVRIPEEPENEIAIDFWVPALPPRIVRRQWEHLRGVRVVQALWAGVDTLLNIFPPDVIFCDGRGVHDIPTAEWTLAAILAMQKSLPFFFDHQRQGKWALGQQANQIDQPGPTRIKNPPAKMRDIADSTVLIVGYGAIGEAVEKRLAAFGAKFLRVATRAREGVESVQDLEELLPKADIVVLTAPLTSQTRGMIDAHRLGQMKPGALLVNASRGAIVETDALLDALTANRIRAAVDVTDPEPLPETHPLWNAPNLLITPHVGGDSERFFQRAFQLVREQTDRYVRGEPLLNRVTGEY